MPVPVQELIARLDREVTDPRKTLVATDGDGTLWSGDVGEDFFFAFTRENRVRASAFEALRSLATEFSIEAKDAEIATRLYEGYVHGKVPEDRICEMIAWLAAGHSRSEVQAIVRATLEREKLSTRMQAEAVAIVEWARARKIDVYVVSASPDPVVCEAAELLGLPPECVLAVRPTYEGDAMTPDVERPIPYGAGKAAALARVADGRTIAVACGDNVFDAEMLRAAKVPVAIRPKKRLLDRAHEIPGLLILEPIV